MSAATHRGKYVTALLRRGVRSVMFGLGMTCAFFPLSSHSNSESSLKAAPTALSTFFSIPHSLPRANAGHRGLVASQ